MSVSERISQYALMTDVQPGDLLAAVDVDDTSMGPSGTTKRMRVDQLPGAVYSVNGHTGAVTLAASDVGAVPVQPWVFTPETHGAGAKRDGRVLQDVAITSGGNVATSASAPWTSADVGKVFVIPGAGGFLNVPLCGSITAVSVNGMQATLSVTATRTVSSNGMIYGTDDTAAIQAAINAAVAWAQSSPLGICVLQFSAGIYCVAGALTGIYQRAQLTLPYVVAGGAKVHLQILGPTPASGPQHWLESGPPTNGAVIASMLYSDTSLFGPPPACIIGAPVTGSGLNFGGAGGTYSDMRVTWDGVNLLATYRSSYAGADFYGCAQANLITASYFCMAKPSAASGGWPPYVSGAANPSSWHTFGFRMPAAGNNAQVGIGIVTVYGPYYAVIFADHLEARTIIGINCFAAAVIAHSEGIGTAHPCHIGTLIAELCSRPIFVPTDGEYGGTPTSQALVVDTIGIEGFDVVVDDASGSLFGSGNAEAQSVTGFIPAGKNGAGSFDLNWVYQPRGAMASPPALPASGVPLVNTTWARGTAVIKGGTVTDILLDGKSTGLTGGAIPVRNGGSIAVNYSVAPSLAWIVGP